jgi:hypothetical protein
MVNFATLHLVPPAKTCAANPVVRHVKVTRLGGGIYRL